MSFQQQNELIKSNFSQTLKHARPRLQKILESFEVPPEDAEDIIQEAMLSMMARWDRIREPESWLIGAVKKRCILYWRKRRGTLHEAVDAKILELLGSPPAEGGELSADLKEVLERLPTRCRELLKLRYGLGYGPSEAADILGYHASTIRKVTNRCLAALTQQLLAVGLSEQTSTED